MPRATPSGPPPPEKRFGPAPEGWGSGLDAVVVALTAGLVVAIPTDTVYGLAVDPRSPGATDLLFALKHRPSTVELPVLVADLDQAEALAGSDGLPSVTRRLVDRFWPGSLTIVMERRAGIAWNLGGDGRSIGLRCPSHPMARELCRRVGPLATTSANRHGKPPITTAAEVVHEFGDSVATVLDGGMCDGTPSTVIAVSGVTVRCIRDGAVAWSEIQEIAAQN